MGLYWNLAKGVGRASKSISDATGRAVATNAGKRVLRQGLRASRHGVLRPGDPDPPPGAPDFYDYRGVAPERAVQGWVGAPYSLGRYAEPGRGPRSPLGVDFDTLRRHAAVIGPTGSGKTKSILVPWAAQALREGHSVVMTDVSGDLVDDLAAARTAGGPFNARLAGWDYTNPRQSVSWNWLAGLHDEEALVSTVEAIIGRDNPNDPQPFFHQRDRRILRGAIELLLAAEPAAAPSRLIQLTQDRKALASLAGRAPNSAGARRVADILTVPGHEYTKAVSGVINALEPFDHPGVRQVTTANQLDLTTVFNEPSLLMVGAPLHGGRTAAVLSALMLSQLIRQVYTRFTHANGTHVFFIIDEAPRVKDRINLEELLAVSRRARVSGDCLLNGVSGPTR